MDRHKTIALMAASIYGGLAIQLSRIQDETMYKIKAQQLQKEALATAESMYGASLHC